MTTFKMYKKISSQEFCNVLLDLFNNEVQTNTTEKDFIAINLYYILGLSSNRENNISFKNLQILPVEIEKKNLDKITKNIENNEANIRRYIRKVYLLSMITTLTIFILTLFLLKQSLVLSIFISLIYFVIDFIGINKTIGKRYEKYYQKKINIDVNPDLKKYIQYYLSI